MTTAATTTITHFKTIRRPSEIDDALDWLAHGAELARDLRGDKAKHQDAIWQLLVEAVEVIDKAPDQERQWLTSGTRSSWKSPGLSRAELIDLERIRFLNSMKPYDAEQTRYSSQWDDEERALGVLAWLRWLHAAPSGDKLRKAAVALVRHDDYGIALELYSGGRKTDRQNVNQIKIRTIGFILNGLKEYLGIVPGGGISFRCE
ncbi:hypothetical protein ABIB06_000495 [Bradyrhizobium sp. LB8.2]|uniref:hypothetical protein n=1 Tax=Bradyrhizobium sp. LB8.2 TaxID=3156330 RepID=UPI00339391C2